MVADCKHKYISLGVRTSIGENLLGHLVTALIEDIGCEKCDTKGIKLVKNAVSRENIKWTEEEKKE